MTTDILWEWSSHFKPDPRPPALWPVDPQHFTLHSLLFLRRWSADTDEGLLRILMNTMDTGDGIQRQGYMTSELWAPGIREHYQ